MAPRSRKIAAAACLLTIFVIVSSGCGVIEDLITGGENSTSDLPTVQTDPGLAPENIDTGEAQNAGDGATIANPYEVTLYFADAQGTSLVPEVRTIEKAEGIARAAMAELIEGPSPGNGLLPTVPQGTALLDINVKEDGLCIVNFSSQLLEEASGEVIDGNLMVYSIVNTLAEFPTIDRVEFRIEGETVESLGENISASAPLYADPGIISK